MSKRKIIIEKIICELETMEVDSNTMEYILREVGLESQVLKQLIQNHPAEELKEILEECLTAHIQN